MTVKCSKLCLLTTLHPFQILLSVFAGFGGGDPHIITLDGYHYTYNGIGEFWLIQSIDGSFSLQARAAQVMTPTNTAAQATAFVAFAISASDTGRVQIQLAQNKRGMWFL